MQNKFSSSISRFSSTVFNVQDIKSFDFEFGLISKNIEKEHFTNFAGSEIERGYNLVTDYYISYLNNDYSFLDNFQMDELSPGFRADRLFKIIRNIQKIKYKKQDCKHILKMKCDDDVELHFFFSRHKNNLKLILIDLYHLGIYSKLYKDNKSELIPIEKKYKRHRNNSYDLCEIKKLKGDELKVTN